MKEKFAVIKLGGAQHLVKEGDVISVNRLDAEPNKNLEVTEVLLIGNGDDVKIGTPFVDKSSVTAKVIEHLRGEKVVTRTFKAKSRYRRTVGHRQELTKIEITKIS